MHKLYAIILATMLLQSTGQSYASASTNPTTPRHATGPKPKPEDYKTPDSRPTYEGLARRPKKTD